MTSQIILSGGPLAGAIISVDDAVADNNGVPGTEIPLTHEVPAIDDNGIPYIDEKPCVYRVVSLETKRIGGRAQSSGQAVYAG